MTSGPPSGADGSGKARSRTAPRTAPSTGSTRRSCPFSMNRENPANMWPSGPISRPEAERRSRRPAGGDRRALDRCHRRQGFERDVTSWNSGAAAIFGFAVGEMVGQPILRLIPSDRQAEEERILRLIRQGESVRSFDTERLRKDGSRVSVSVTVSAIRDEHGTVVGASKVARDITNAKTDGRSPPGERGPLPDAFCVRARRHSDCGRPEQLPSMPMPACARCSVIPGTN